MKHSDKLLLVLAAAAILSVLAWSDTSVTIKEEIWMSQECPNEWQIDKQDRLHITLSCTYQAQTDDKK